MSGLQFSDRNTFNTAKQDLQNLFHDPQLKRTSIISTFIIIFIWILYISFYGHLPPQIPLLYSKPWGEEQLVELSFLLILPLSITFTHIINTVLASFMISKNKLLSQLLIYGQLLCSIIVIISIIQLLLLVA